MVRKTRSDKKDTICKRCGYKCSIPQKLLSIQEINQDNNQEKVQVQTPVVHAQKRDRQREKLQAVNQIPVYKPELQREAPTTHDRDYNGNEVTGEERILPTTLKDCQLLYHDLLQANNEAFEKVQIDSEAGPGLASQANREKANNEEFRHLRKITEEKQKRNLEFRKQEELGMALKRRAIAVHRAKVPKSYSDNSSNIQKMLESRRKQFREILEKEFDKRGQLKFTLCSLTKFLIDNKPENEKQEKKNSRINWLRNKQIIVYNRDEIDNYLSNAFEQILYQVEERG
ncbi:34971_t:CDS:2, partial [Racocetra persica]